MLIDITGINLENAKYFSGLEKGGFADWEKVFAFQEFIRNQIESAVDEKCSQ